MCIHTPKKAESSYLGVKAILKTSNPVLSFYKILKRSTQKKSKWLQKIIVIGKAMKIETRPSVLFILFLGVN